MTPFERFESLLFAESCNTGRLGRVSPGHGRHSERNPYGGEAFFGVRLMGTISVEAPPPKKKKNTPLSRMIVPRRDQNSFSSRWKWRRKARCPSICTSASSRQVGVPLGGVGWGGVAVVVMSVAAMGGLRVEVPPGVDSRLRTASCRLFQRPSCLLPRCPIFFFFLTSSLATPPAAMCRLGSGRLL